MSDYAERVVLQEKVSRSVKMAITYLQKASAALHWYKSRPILTDYWRLLDQALDTALDIVEELPDDFFLSSEVEDYFGIASALNLGGKFNSSDSPLERAQKVVAAIESRRERGITLRKIMSLENTEGRTEEEAKMFSAKADELRQKLKGA